MRASFPSPSVARAALALSTVLLVPSLLAAQGDYTAPRSGSISTSGATSIAVANGSGQFTVTGNPGATAVRATGTAHAGRADQLPGVKLLVERQGDRIVVHPDINGGLGNCNCWMDLNVEVPTNIPLEVTDGSGGVEIRNVGAADVRTGSGGVHIEGTSGDLSIRTGSGHATASDIHGDVRASTGSGGLTLSGVTGSVTIDRSGSGGVSLSNVSGSVHVGSSGSGSVSANDVGGDLTVDHEGSGSVHYTGVKGKVSIPTRY